MTAETASTGQHLIQHQSSLERKPPAPRVTIKGDCDLDGPGVQGRVLQPPGPRPQALADQPEVTVLQVSQSAMQQFGGRAAGRTHRVVTFEQDDLVTLLKQGPRAHHAVNTGAYTRQPQGIVRIRSLQKALRRDARFEPVALHRSFAAAPFHGKVHGARTGRCVTKQARAPHYGARKYRKNGGAPCGCTLKSS